MRLATPALTVAVLLFSFFASAAFAVTSGCVQGKPCFGMSKDDRLMGTSGDDEILARSGRDFVNTRSGSDVVRGGPGAAGDEYAPGGLFGDAPRTSADSVRDGNDMVHGREALYGFGGSDLLVGGGRADYIFAQEFCAGMGRPGVVRSKNPGTNIVSAGPGGDHIEAADDRRDVIDRGGKDAVRFDEGLEVVSSDCQLENIIHYGG